MISAGWEWVGDALWISLSSFTALDLLLSALAITGKKPRLTCGANYGAFGEGWDACWAVTSDASAWAILRLSEADAFLRSWLTPLLQATKTWPVAVALFVGLSAGTAGRAAPAVLPALDLVAFVVALLATGVGIGQTWRRSLAAYRSKGQR